MVPKLNKKWSSLRMIWCYSIQWRDHKDYAKHQDDLLVLMTKPYRKQKMKCWIINRRKNNLIEPSLNDIKNSFLQKTYVGIPMPFGTVAKLLSEENRASRRLKHTKTRAWMHCWTLSNCWNYLVEPQIWPKRSRTLVYSRSFWRKLLWC
jgi:hypothetical protein